MNEAAVIVKPLYLPERKPESSEALEFTEVTEENSPIRKFQVESRKDGESFVLPEVKRRVFEPYKPFHTAKSLSKVEIISSLYIDNESDDLVDSNIPTPSHNQVSKYTADCIDFAITDRSPIKRSNDVIMLDIDEEKMECIEILDEVAKQKVCSELQDDVITAGYKDCPSEEVIRESFESANESGDDDRKSDNQEVFKDINAIDSCEIPVDIPLREQSENKELIYNHLNTYVDEPNTNYLHTPENASCKLKEGPVTDLYADLKHGFDLREFTINLHRNVSETGVILWFLNKNDSSHRSTRSGIKLGNVQPSPRRLKRNVKVKKTLPPEKSSSLTILNITTAASSPANQETFEELVAKKLAARGKKLFGVAAQESSLKPHLKQSSAEKPKSRVVSPVGANIPSCQTGVHNFFRTEDKMKNQSIHSSHQTALTQKKSLILSTPVPKTTTMTSCQAMHKPCKATSIPAGSMSTSIDVPSLCDDNGINIVETIPSTTSIAVEVLGNNRVNAFKNRCITTTSFRSGVKIPKDSTLSSSNDTITMHPSIRHMMHLQASSMDQPVSLNELSIHKNDCGNIEPPRKKQRACSVNSVCDKSRQISSAVLRNISALVSPLKCKCDIVRCPHEKIFNNFETKPFSSLSQHFSKHAHPIATKLIGSPSKKGNFRPSLLPKNSPIGNRSLLNRTIKQEILEKIYLSDSDIITITISHDSSCDDGSVNVIHISSDSEQEPQIKMEEELFVPKPCHNFDAEFVGNKVIKQEIKTEDYLSDEDIPAVRNYEWRRRRKSSSKKRPEVFVQRPILPTFVKTSDVVKDKFLPKCLTQRQMSKLTQSMNLMTFTIHVEMLNESVVESVINICKENEKWNESKALVSAGLSQYDVQRLGLAQVRLPKNSPKYGFRRFTKKRELFQSILKDPSKDKQKNFRIKFLRSQEKRIKSLAVAKEKKDLEARNILSIRRALLKINSRIANQTRFWAYLKQKNVYDM